jgi:DNA helicase-2/ATP-dependent DNA helicase PcrA
VITFPGAPDTGTRTLGQQPGARQPASQPVSINLNKGDRVRHAKFGPGRILSIEPVAGDAILLIEFQSGDKKRLLARMANLEKI